MKRIWFGLSILSAMALLAACSQDTPEPKEQTDVKPHIVVLIADDLGVDYAPCYSPDSPMTFLRSQCDNAAVFTQAYTHPVCTPSRAAMMTGRHTFRTGANDVFLDAAKLPLSEITLPEKAKSLSLGYRFSAFGKWHLADNQNGSVRNPILQGFDYFEGTPRQKGTYNYWNYDWFVNGRNTGRVSTYKTTKIVDAVISDFEKTSKDTPQFMWTGFVNPHIPYHAPPKHLHTQDELPLKVIKASTRKNPDEGRFRINHRQPQVDIYFKAMLETLDSEIMRLVTEFTDKSERPIIFIFLGDNGTSTEVYQGDDGSDARAKATLYQGGVHVPLMVWSTDGRFKTGPNEDLVQLTDLFPTLLNMMNGKPVNAGKDHIIDGQSFLPLLLNKPSRRESRQFAYFERGVPRKETPSTALGVINTSGLKLILHDDDIASNTSPNSYIEIFDTRKDEFERDNLYLNPCDVNKAAIMAMFEFINEKFVSEPNPKTEYNPSLYRDLLENMQAECP